MFLNCYYFFFFFYFCTTATIGTTITIISNNVSKGEGTLEISYKLWSSKFRREEGASNSKACYIASFRSWEHAHTHKVWLQHKICTRWCNPTYICFPYTWVLRLTFGLCTLVCFWTCNHVMSSSSSSSGRRRRKRGKKYLLHAIVVKFTNVDRSTVPSQSSFVRSVSTFVYHRSSLLTHRILQTVCCVRTL